MDIMIMHQFADNKLKGNDMKLYLVRHGQTDLNSEDRNEDRLRGWLDISLNKAGMDEADASAKKLEDKGINKIISSDLERCRQTSEIIAAHTGAKIAYSTALRPWDVGCMGGEKSLECLPKMRFYAMHPEEKIPEGESLNTFVGRFLPAFKKALEEVEKGHGPLVLVASYRNLKLSEAYWAAGMKGNDFDMDVFLADHIHTGSIMEWNFDGKKWLLAPPEAPSD